MNNLPDFLMADETLTPTIDIPALNSAALTKTNFPDVAPASNVNGSGGFDLGQVTHALANMFDTGVSVYNQVAKTLGTQQIGATATPVAAAPAPVLGLSQTQWVIIGGGAAVVLALLIFKRR